MRVYTGFEKSRYKQEDCNYLEVTEITKIPEIDTSHGTTPEPPFMEISRFLRAAQCNTQRCAWGVGRGGGFTALPLASLSPSPSGLSSILVNKICQKKEKYIDMHNLLVCPSFFSVFSFRSRVGIPP